MRFAVFCKSYRNDLERCAQLVNSHERLVRDKTPFVVCTPRSDTALFKARIGADRATFLTDEDLLGGKARQSWKTQQLVKLRAWRGDFADAWLWVDSDSYFIRPFSRDDFVRRDGSVALPVARGVHVLDDRWDEILRYVSDRAAIERVDESALRPAHARKPLSRIPWWQRLHDRLGRVPFSAREPRISRFFGRDGASLHFLPGAVWTVDSLRSFEREVLDPCAVTLEELLEHAPWEGTWLGEWELYRGAPGRHLVESCILHIRSDSVIVRARREGVTEARLARRYIGIQLAAGHQDLTRLDTPSAAHTSGP